MTNAPGTKSPTAEELPAYIERWLAAKSEAEIDALCEGERMLYPDVVHLKDGPGRAREVPCYIRVPTILEHAKFVTMTNAKVAQLAGVPKDRQPITRVQAEAFLGAAAYEELRLAFVVGHCVYEATRPSDPNGQRAMMFAPELTSRWMTGGNIFSTYEKIDFYSRMEDVRIPDLGPAMFEALVLAIAKSATTLPLVDCAGSYVAAFIVKACQELARARQTSASSSLSSETSTQD